MWLNRIAVYIASLLIILEAVTTEDGQPVWKWTCKNGFCEKTRNLPNGNEPALSLEACKMFCGDFGLLWPSPTGDMNLGNFLSKIKLSKIKVMDEKQGKSSPLIEGAADRFKQVVAMAVPKGVTPKDNGKGVDVYLVNQNPNIREFSLEMDESYELKIQAINNDKINATIVGQTFFGVRHGLETLSQLIIYDDLRNQMLMVRDATISDKPVYPYRGLLLDTSRNYIPVDGIKRTIDAMAAVKLNTFHWHITDTHSFPFVSERRPELAKLGAYSPTKVYTRKMMEDVVQYAHVRGVRVLPEIDAPAHVGEGWQDSGVVMCLDAQPWSEYCVEPPCGQFNPVKPELYNYLEDLYTDMAEIFKPDIFHIGGDEVSIKCWNSSAQIRDFMTQNQMGLEKKDFLGLWEYFLLKSRKKIYKAVGKQVPLISFSNTLSEPEFIERFMNKEDFIIQMWTTGSDPQIGKLLDKGYRLIMSPYDSLYFDCGFSSWISEGNNWCSPYIGWQKVYDNASSALFSSSPLSQILGGEAALWTEQADVHSMDGRFWPRAAAFAERYWAEPQTTWKQAQERILGIRERLVRMGIESEALQPEWCYRNEGKCRA